MEFKCFLGSEQHRDVSEHGLHAVLSIAQPHTRSIGFATADKHAGSNSQPEGHRDDDRVRIVQ